MIHNDYFFEYDKSNIAKNYKQCVQAIMQLKGINKKFYIGATHDQQTRLDKHIKEKNMKNMYLLCECPTKLKTIKLEQKLINRFGGKCNNKNNIERDNIGKIIQGGGGEGITYEKNYIYVMLV